MIALALIALAPLPTVPGLAHGQSDNHTEVFLHAREALRREKPDDVLKLWLLRNMLVDKGQKPTSDADFASAVWVALGRRGICPDGFPRDDDGAGIWPLAMHNFVLSRMRKADINPPPPWPAFTVSRQARSVSLHDVLSLEELRTVSFSRGFCTAAGVSFAEAGGVQELQWPDLDDRLVVGTIMKWLLERARATVNPERIEHAALIDARIFDLEVALVELRARRARENANNAAQLARSLGLPDTAVEDVRARLAVIPPATDQSALLKRSLNWPAEAWLTIGPERRQALFARTKDVEHDHEKRQKLILDVLDGLIARGAGKEAEGWIGFLYDDPETRAAVTRGGRGERLLALDKDSGFTHGSVIALHRGVAFLEEGSMHDALSSFGFALKHSDASSAGPETRSLALRWLSYVAAQFETTPELVDTLRALATRRDVARILEDLLWRAALRADQKSFDIVVERAQKGGSIGRLAEILRPLSVGNAGAFSQELARRAEDEPQGALTLIQQLIARIESEEIEVRRAHAPTLRSVLERLRKLEGNEQSSTYTRAVALRDRTLSILDGLGDVPREDIARTLAPDHDAYAGSVRLAPNDPLPWPFRPPTTSAPSAFLPVVMIPVDKGSAPAWRITE